jgi:hypothetical protein
MKSLKNKKVKILDTNKSYLKARKIVAGSFSSFNYHAYHIYLPHEYNFTKRGKSRHPKCPPTPLPLVGIMLRWFSGSFSSHL